MGLRLPQIGGFPLTFRGFPIDFECRSYNSVVRNVLHWDIQNGSPCKGNRNLTRGGAPPEIW